MNYILLKDGKIIGEGEQAKMEKRLNNALHNQKMHGTSYKYEMKKK